MLAVWMPVNRRTSALVVSCDLLLGGLVVAEVPALYGAIVGAKGKLYSIGRGPLDVVYATVDASILVSAVAGHDVLFRVTKIPQAHRRVMACRQQQMALVRIKGQFVDLTRVLVQPSQLDTRPVEVIQDDFAIGSSSRDMRVEVAMRPLDVLDSESVTLAGV
jgi:hypothetical protein